MGINANFASVIVGELSKARRIGTSITTIGAILTSSEARALGVSRTKPLELDKLTTKHTNASDIVVDSSTLSNVFDPASVLQRIASLLSDKGRLFLSCMGSDHHCPYSIITPLWLFDYFVANGFARCEVYVVVTKIDGNNVIMVDPSTMVQGPWTPNIEARNAAINLIVVAERDVKSGNSKTPVQHQYRTSDQASEYNRKFKVIAGNARPPVLRSTLDCFVHVPPGYKFVAPKS